MAVTLVAALRLLAASQALLFVCALGISANPLRIRLSGATMGLGIICYLLVPLAQVYAGPAAPVMRLLAGAIPLVLLWFTWTLFQDDRRIPPAIVLAGAAYVVVLGTSFLFRWDREVETAIAMLLQFVKLAFAAGAILIVWRGRHTDLVEERLRLRLAFAAGIGVVVVLVVVTELVTGWRVPRLLEASGMAGMFALATAVNLGFLRFNPRFTLTGNVAVSTGDVAMVPDPAKPVDPILAELTRLMTQERLYADHDLRIASLAARLKVPEYRLRRSINQQLGHRNFNQFINGYRIEEAARRLLTDPNLPVLSIALDVGFRSMSSFNAAFRDRFGVSPTRFRVASSTKN